MVFLSNSWYALANQNLNPKFMPRIFNGSLIQRITNIIFLFLCPAMFFLPRSAPIFFSILVVCSFLKNGWSLCSLRGFPPLFIGIFGLCLWGGISSLWSVDPQGSLFLCGRLILLAGGGFVFHKSATKMTDDEINQLLKFLFLGLCIAGILLIINNFLGSPRTLWKGKTSAQAFVPLGLSLVLLSFVVPKNKLFFVFICFLNYALTFVDCDTAILALWSGGGSAFLFYLWPKGMKQALIIISTISILAMPFIVKTYVNQPFISAVNDKIKIHSYIHRLYVMQATASRITNKWFLGYGLDSSRHSMFGEKKEWPMSGDYDNYTIKSAEIPTHPHNAPLQLWLELGCFGALWIALVNFLILQSIPASRNPYVLSVIGLYTAAQIIAEINLGFWQNWWLAILLIAGALSARLINCDFKKC